MGKVIDIAQSLRRLESSLLEMNDETTEYGELVRTVESRLATLHDLQLPEKTDFQNVPIDYDDMRRCKQEIERLCTKFTLNIHNSLVEYPSSVKGGLDFIDRKLNNICKKVGSIIDEGENMPEDELLDAILDITDYMNEIIGEAEDQVENLNSLIGNLDKYANEYTDTIILDIKTILDDVSNSGDAYLDVEKALKDEKEKLESQITKDAINIAVGCVVAIAGVVGAIASLALLIPSGGNSLAIGISVICGLITVGGGLFTVGMDSYDIVQCKKAIQDKIDALDDIEKDKLTLKNWGDSVEDAKNGLGDLKGDIQKIQKSWVEVKDGFSDIIRYLKAEEVNPRDKKWDKILEYMEKCKDTSSKIREKIESMIIEDHKFSLAKVEIGMTKEQIEEAIKSAEMVSFKEYMLAV